jgi:hypothetical protein
MYTLGQCSSSTGLGVGQASYSHCSVNEVVRRIKVTYSPNRICRFHFCLVGLLLKVKKKTNKTIEINSL